MTLGQRMRERREELGLSRAELAKKLGVTLSAVSNYETGTSFPREAIFLRLFDSLETDPNTLLRDSFRGGGLPPSLTKEEQTLLKNLRTLSPPEREIVERLAETLRECREDREIERSIPEARQIPLYRSPAAAGYTTPVFGEDFDTISVKADVPRSAEFAVRLRDDCLSPWIADGGTAYVNHDPLRPGDVGLFSVEGKVVCRQYYKDPAGMIYLFSLNRARSDADLLLTPGGGQNLICLGRVILRAPPLPGEAQPL